MQFCFCFVKVCYVDFQLKKFDQENVKLEPSAIEMLSPIELTQYYIKVKSFSNITCIETSGIIFVLVQSWNLNQSTVLEDGHVVPSSGLKMEIVFKRRVTNELLTTYLPSFLLLLITYATTFFKQFYFEAAVTVNLTVMLVTTNLFIRLVCKGV